MLSSDVPPVSRVVCIKPDFHRDGSWHIASQMTGPFIKRNRERWARSRHGAQYRIVDAEVSSVFTESVLIHLLAAAGIEVGNRIRRARRAELGDEPI